MHVHWVSCCGDSCMILQFPDTFASFWSLWKKIQSSLEFTTYRTVRQNVDRLSLPLGCAGLVRDLMWVGRENAKINQFVTPCASYTPEILFEHCAEKRTTEGKFCSMRCQICFKYTLLEYSEFSDTFLVIWGSCAVLGSSILSHPNRATETNHQLAASTKSMCIPVSWSG